MEFFENLSDDNDFNFLENVSKTQKEMGNTKPGENIIFSSPKDKLKVNEENVCVKDFDEDEDFFKEFEIDDFEDIVTNNNSKEKEYHNTNEDNSIISHGLDTLLDTTTTTTVTNGENEGSMAINDGTEYLSADVATDDVSMIEVNASTNANNDTTNGITNDNVVVDTTNNELSCLNQINTIEINQEIVDVDNNSMIKDDNNSMIKDNEVSSSEGDKDVKEDKMENEKQVNESIIKERTIENPVIKGNLFKKIKLMPLDNKVSLENDKIKTNTTLTLLKPINNIKLKNKVNDIQQQPIPKITLNLLSGIKTINQDEKQIKKKSIKQVASLSPNKNVDDSSIDNIKKDEKDEMMMINKVREEEEIKDDEKKRELEYEYKKCIASNFFNNIKLLQKMLKECKDIHDEVMETRVRIAITSNELVRLDRPSWNYKMNELKRKAKEALTIDD